MVVLVDNAARRWRSTEVSSVRDSDRILGLLSSKTAKAAAGNGGVKEHLLLTRHSPKRVATGEMMSVADVSDILGLDVVGVVPDRSDVLSASNAGTPVILNENERCGQRLRRCRRPPARETKPLRFTEEPRKVFSPACLEVEQWGC